MSNNRMSLRHPHTHARVCHVPCSCSQHTPMLGRLPNIVRLMPHVTNIHISDIKELDAMYHHFCRFHAAASSKRGLLGVGMATRTMCCHLPLRVCHNRLFVHRYAAVPSFCRSTRPRRENASKEEPPLCCISAVLRDATRDAEHPSSTARTTMNVHISERLDLMAAVSDGWTGQAGVLTVPSETCTPSCMRSAASGNC